MRLSDCKKIKKKVKRNFRSMLWKMLQKEGRKESCKDRLSETVRVERKMSGHSMQPRFATSQLPED